MKKIISVAAVLVMAVLMLAGCGKSSSLEGKWVQSISGVEMNALEFTDKTVTWTVAGQESSATVLNYTAGDGKLVCTNDNGVEIINSEYTLDGDTLTVDIGAGMAEFTKS